MLTSSQFKSIPPDFDFNIIKFADLVFYYNQEFKKVFNNGAPIPRLTNSFKEWYKENRSIIRDSDLTQNDLLDYFDNFKESNNLNTNEI